MIVRCTEDDLKALRKISIDTFAETFHEDNAPENMENYLATAFHPDKLKAELLQKQSQFYFSYDQEELAGYLKVNLADIESSNVSKGNHLEIERIYVLQPFQKAGHGKRLMEKAFEIAKLYGKDEIWLGVWEKNEQAIKFYERQGFVKTGEHYFQLGDEKQKDYIMTLFLNGA